MNECVYVFFWREGSNEFYFSFKIAFPLKKFVLVSDIFANKQSTLLES